MFDIQLRARSNLGAPSLGLKMRMSADMRCKDHVRSLSDFARRMSQAGFPAIDLVHISPEQTSNAARHAGGSPYREFMQSNTCCPIE